MYNLWAGGDVRKIEQFVGGWKLILIVYFLLDWVCCLSYVFDQVKIMLENWLKDGAAKGKYFISNQQYSNINQ